LFLRTISLNSECCIETLINTTSEKSADDNADDIVDVVC